MKQHKIFIGMFSAVLFIAGCYTQLMTPQEYVEARQQKINAEKTVFSSNAGSSINYDRNCLSCHSKYELDDRFIEMQSAGITTAHGYILSQDLWNYPILTTPYNPDPYGWYNPFPSSPWWLPPVVSSSGGAGGTSTEAADKGRQRDDGPSRPGGTTVREPIPAYAPPTPSGTTPPAPTMPAPAVSSAPAQTTQTQQPAQSTSGDNTSRKTSSDDSSRRNDGPTRPR